MAIMNKIRASILAEAFGGNPLSHPLIKFTPRTSQKSKNVHTDILIQEILKGN